MSRLFCNSAFQWFQWDRAEWKGHVLAFVSVADHGWRFCPGTLQVQDQWWEETEKNDLCYFKASSHHISQHRLQGHVFEEKTRCSTELALEDSVLLGFRGRAQRRIGSGGLIVVGIFQMLGTNVPGLQSASLGYQVAVLLATGRLETQRGLVVCGDFNVTQRSNSY